MLCVLSNVNTVDDTLLRRLQIQRKQDGDIRLPALPFLSRIKLTLHIGKKNSSKNIPY